ncbi:GlxA family transcriptional regulator [uncultured Roseobacter sp.]|uniref:GlxA family transcriptional regulator n=1 Tax=uncultured Roseobacter sp. TaxID=114847 RepID=UPI002624BE58|nr:GlxA family transcriptional regulator [uncultured Roseobacter sp.]
MKSAEKLHTIVLVLDETNTLSFAAAVDPLRAANRQAGRNLFDWQFATPENRDVSLTSGLIIPAAPLHDVTTCDVLIVVAGFNLHAQSTPRLRSSLRRLAARAARVAGIDGGPWIMAQAGVLDGHRATTHWEDLDAFAQRFTAVTCVDARFVDSGSRLTSGGAAPALEMMLHLIAQHHGAALAERVASSFIYDAAPTPARPQGRQRPRAHNAPLTARAQDMMQANLEDPITIKVIARRLGVSLRALQLQFQASLRTTPQAYYLGLRLGEADRLVTQTALPLQDVALITGFASQSSFARAYRQRFGVSARQRRSDLATFNRASDAGGGRRQYRR